MIYEKGGADIVNSVNTDQIAPKKEQWYLGLHCLHRLISLMVNAVRLCIKFMFLPCLENSPLGQV